MFLFVYSSWWWSSMSIIVPYCQSLVWSGVSVVLYSGPGCFLLAFGGQGCWWSLLVWCVCVGLHGWSSMFMLVCCGALAWSDVVMVVCSGPELWFWASSTHAHLRCSLQLRLRLCLTSRMQVSFYEAGDVPAVWLCFHPNSLLNVSRQSCQNQEEWTKGDWI